MAAPKSRGTLAKWMKEQRQQPVRGDVYAPACPSRQVLGHVTSRWGVLVLVALIGEAHRFSELRRTVAGISEKMLAQTLQVLEADGFVHRKVYPEVPPHVEYSLTELGREAAVLVETLTDWIEENLERILKGRAKPPKQRGNPREVRTIDSVPRIS